MPFLLILTALVALPLLALAVLVASFLPLWLQAKASGVPVSLLEMAFMRLRQVAPERIVNAGIALAKAGMPVPRERLEAHLLAGGDLEGVTEALISAQKAGLVVDFAKIAGLDLAGRKVVAAVRARVNPKVLAVPPANAPVQAIAGVCQDGIRLGVRARVTVRTNLDRLVGGAGEDTVVARVGEGIVAAIGRAASHKEILAEPERISRYLLEHGLDSGTCFEILSVDIAAVDVLDNVGARLAAARAETDKQIAQAQAEVRRANAVATGHEMRARTIDSHAGVIAARSQLPLAGAAAFREGNFGRRLPVPPAGHSRLKWRLRPD
jgi:uncharacterized protein YqfA (UPF0365 family)